MSIHSYRKQTLKALETYVDMFTFLKGMFTFLKHLKHLFKTLIAFGWRKDCLYAWDFCVGG